MMSTSATRVSVRSREPPDARDCASNAMATCCRRIPPTATAVVEVRSTIPSPRTSTANLSRGRCAPRSPRSRKSVRTSQSGVTGSPSIRSSAISGGKSSVISWTSFTSYSGKWRSRVFTHRIYLPFPPNQVFGLRIGSQHSGCRCLRQHRMRLSHRPSPALTEPEGRGDTSQKCRTARISDVSVIAREQGDLGGLGFCLGHLGRVEISVLQIGLQRCL